jgi:hypothetical protein
MQIIKLKIFNYLGLSNYAIDELGQLNRITGDNGLGKSSVVKAIREAFSSSGVDPELIHLGSDKAEIIVRLDNEVEIFRTITQASNTAKVTIRGEPVAKPQSFLNSLLGPINFDPTAFIRLKDMSRVKMLLSAMPLVVAPGDIIAIITKNKIELESMWETNYDFENSADFSKHGLIVIQDIAKKVYDRRAEVNRDLTRRKKSIEQDRLDLGETPNAEEFKGFDINEAAEELAQQREANNSLDKDKQTLDDLRRQNEEVTKEIERLEKQLAQAKKNKAELVERGKTLAASIEEREAYDTKILSDRIASYNKYQEVLVALKNISKREAELEKDAETHTALDDLHKVLVNEVPKDLLAKMKLPVPGLEIKGDRIFVDNVNIDKMSASEQIDLAFEIATSLAGDLKLICMDGFESVVGKNRKKIIAKAEEKAKKGYQFVIAEAVEDAPLQIETAKVEAEDMAESEEGETQTSSAREF